MGEILVLGGTGKTGRRVVERLSARGASVRVGSRRGEPPFDRAEPATWEGLPADLAGWLADLVATTLDGRNAHLTDGVRQALGRPPRDFAEYAARAAATGVRQAPADGGTSS